MRYMLITFFKKQNGQIDEQVGFAKRISNQDSQMCNIILDYLDRKVIKCVIEGNVTPTTFERMHDYYKSIYPDLINQLEKSNSHENTGKGT